MSLNTSLKGRLRNTNLPLTSVLHPLFEAVVNSIHSIDSAIDRKKLPSIMEGKIEVRIIRSGQATAFPESKAEIIGFEIIDNGLGFNQENFKSFQTLDSEHKIELGCRGVGRLLWLKAFNKVSVKSTFEEGGIRTTREFDFNVERDIHNEDSKNTPGAKFITSIKLLNIRKEYSKYLRKNPETIARDLLEHVLWYFIRKGGAPEVFFIDGEVRISLQEEYDALMLNASEPSSFKIKNEVFEITHVKLKSSLQNKHSINYSAANRVVKEESLQGKIPGLFGFLKDGQENFAYMGFLTSDYLTEKVNPERVGFNISESVEGMFAEDEISFSEIRKNSLLEISKYLEEYLVENKKVGKERLKNFVDSKAPRYRPIIDRIPEEEQIVDPSISDKDLDVKLHIHLSAFESQLIAEGHDLLVPDSLENKEDYSQRIDEYLAKASDLKRSDLANYVAHRKVILDLLGKAIEKNPEGKYSKEEVLHKLIMPMQKVSDEIRFEDSNLWLVDERLAFHNYLASDKTINSIPISDSTSNKEPDLIGMNVYDNPLLVNDGSSLPLASITVVEIKRPMRNDAKTGEEKDPIEQALGYLKRVRSGKIVTSTGRPIPNSEQIPGFCYVICDITSTMKDRCDFLDLKVTADKMGYFGYHKTYNTYIEVISFDRLLNMAKERNKAFFDKLGLPST
ncbi:MAG: ATP-binding protein [Bacteroidia bacterium]|nr:ATP-binding protein [Bacteroidia bacterium]